MTSGRDARKRSPRRGDDARFEFGRNWRRFLRVVDEDRIARAQVALLRTLDAPDLRGRTFLDVGSGSGLSSLAALRAGARVTAFDVDPEAVAATRELLRRHAPSDAEWRLELGSALDAEFVQSLGPHDIVHSWGVLHHTGAMWDACEIVADAVPEGGRLLVALYNDAGDKSLVWLRRKRRYVRSPRGVRTLYAWAFIAAAELLFLLRALRSGDLRGWSDRWWGDRPERGMDRYRDWIDWVGGYPYEFASVTEVVAFFEQRGLTVADVFPNDGTGCSEFVFDRAGA